MTTNIRHSSGEAKWGTGPEIVSIAREVLYVARRGVVGSVSPIHFDPFSEDEFNDRVGAYRFFNGDRGRDGFKDRWIDHPACPRADFVLAGFDVASAPEDAVASRYTALVNPPGSDDGDQVKRAWALLDFYHRHKWIDSAVWVAFNLNQLQTLQRVGKRSPLHDGFVRCVPARRLPFVAHSTRPPTRIDRHGDVVDNDDAPSHPSFFVLLPSHDESVAAEQFALFDSMASALGEVF